MAELLADTWPHSYSHLDAQKQVRLLYASDRILFAAFAGKQLVGLIGAIPQYGNTGWELHPLAVAEDYRSRGIGSRLVEALEAAILSHGGIMVYLGTDDDRDQTSLSGVDLFRDPFGEVDHIVNLRRHPYAFYQKLGYRIVGVLPDANGVGKPDIFMAKSLR